MPIRYLTFITLCFIFSSVTWAQNLSLYAEDSPPTNYLKDNQPVGQSVETVKEIQRRVKDKSPIKVVPWNRGYQFALTKKNTAIFLTTRTPERENLFQWVGPLFIDQWVLVARKKDHIKIANLDEAKKVKGIGTYLNDVRDEFLKKEGFTNVDTTQENITNVKKLETGRISLWIISRADFQTLCDQANVPHSNFEIVYKFPEVKTYLAFSKQTSTKLVHKWQKAFQSMVEDGTWKKLNPDQ